MHKVHLVQTWLSCGGRQTKGGIPSFHLGDVEGTISRCQSCHLQNKVKDQIVSQALNFWDSEVINLVCHALFFHLANQDELPSHLKNNQ